MRAANFTGFRTNLKEFLDDVENNNETLIYSCRYHYDK